MADWERGLHVDWFCADQTYEWVGMKKRGRRNTVERHDARGMPVEIRHEVYINAIQLHLPASLGTLLPQEVVTIQRNHGTPYTEDFNHVFAPLDYDTVDASLRSLAIDALTPVLLMLSGPPNMISLSDVARGLFGRGKVKSRCTLAPTCTHTPQALPCACTRCHRCTAADPRRWLDSQCVCAGGPGRPFRI